MEEFHNDYIPPKQRHGCVTAWLILMIFANSVVSGIYIFFSDVVIQSPDIAMNETVVQILGVFALANVGFAVMLFRWMRIGFWGFVITAIGVFVINVSFGMGVANSLLGLLGIGLLFGVLQISPKGGQSAWKNLE